MLKNFRAAEIPSASADERECLNFSHHIKPVILSGFSQNPVQWRLHHPPVAANRLINPALQSRFRT